ncbi:MAG: cytochrome-c oxidase, cbb3-type subunit III [Myxococcota bacterium]|nr:cytochrome-c oxidase, cbb3-type subunit III [Myxococcota bacterium]
MTAFWSVWIIVMAVGMLVACAWLLLANRRARLGDSGDESGKTLDHSVDGLKEFNNPLPVWWVWLFVLTVVFAVGYLALFPGLGTFPGMLGWSSTGQYQNEREQADARYGPIFAAFMEQPIPSLVEDPQAVEIGGRLFANNCSTCHGSDARGGKGYPNLTDGDWLYGGAPETVVQTITNGRVGVMPPQAAALGGEQGVRDMTQYVLSLSGRDHDADAAARAAPKFAQLCVACHTADGTGMQALGAPNLTDDIWLHGGRVEEIEYQIANGRTNRMPAHGEILGDEKIHLLATYVLSLQNGAW